MNMTGAGGLTLELNFMHLVERASKYKERSSGPGEDVETSGIVVTQSSASQRGGFQGSRQDCHLKAC